jgi:hypothetical protein
VAWALPFGTDWERALEECNTQERFMHIVREMYRHRLLSHEVIVRAAIACANTALENVPAEEHHPRNALYAIAVWTAGGTSVNAISDAQRYCQDAARDLPPKPRERRPKITPARSHLLPVVHRRLFPAHTNGARA